MPLQIIDPDHYYFNTRVLTTQKVLNAFIACGKIKVVA